MTEEQMLAAIGLQFISAVRNAARQSGIPSVALDALNPQDYENLAEFVTAVILAVRYWGHSDGGELGDSVRGWWPLVPVTDNIGRN